MNAYTLSRNFIDFSFENPSKIKPNHYALYFFAIEHCNRLGWKKKFGIPTTMTMEAIGIKSYNTYNNTFNDLVNYGFFKLIEKSKNQYSSNIIALSNFNKALDKALDKAFIKHASKLCSITHQSIVSINKQINNITNKQINKETKEQLLILKNSLDNFFNVKNIIQVNNKEKKGFDFYNSLISLGGKKELVDDWLIVRKQKKAINTKTAFNGFQKQVDLSNKNINEILEICINKSWGGFNAKWLENENIKNNLDKNGDPKPIKANFANPII